MDEERQGEEQSLADAWSIAENHLVDEPGAIDQAQANNAEQARQSGEDGGEETGESENEGDDDMMDRISSSPSIDDGGSYLSHLYPHTHLKVWPARCSSLSPTPTTITPTREDFNSSASSPTPVSTAESSPFLQTPQHMPLRRAWAEQEASPLSKAMD